MQVVPKLEQTKHPLVEELRARHPVFRYLGYDIKRTAPDELELQLFYETSPDLRFTSRLNLQGLNTVSNAARLEQFVFQLGLIESLSYWKATCSPMVEIKAGALSGEDMNWWEDLILHGMGEFYYRNQIHRVARGFVEIHASGDVFKESAANSLPSNYQALLLLSGGKDSAVSLEVLKQSGTRFRPLLLNPVPAALDLARIAGTDAPVIATRSLDPLLFDLNRQGYLNGHTPFSAYLAFLGVLVAELSAIPWVVVSNERSAEEGNAVFEGRPINHQYSKSLEFEDRFRAYIKRLGSAVQYFSLLRPLYELQITREFARQPKYFSTFRSCNRGLSTNSWCGACPKCLFSAIALAPFLDSGTLTEIFGRDPFQDETLAPTLSALLGIGDKPFECVGTLAEVQAAVAATLERYREHRATIPKLLTMAEGLLPDSPPQLSHFLTSSSSHHNIPSPLADTLQNTLFKCSATA